MKRSSKKNRFVLMFTAANQLLGTFPLAHAQGFDSISDKESLFIILDKGTYSSRFMTGKEAEDFYGVNPNSELFLPDAGEADPKVIKSLCETVNKGEAELSLLDLGDIEPNAVMSAISDLKIEELVEEKVMSDISSIRLGKRALALSDISNLSLKDFKENKAMSAISNLRLSELKGTKVLSDITSMKVMSNISSLKAMSDISALKIKDLKEAKVLSDISALRISDIKSDKVMSALSSLRLRDLGSSLKMSDISRLPVSKVMSDISQLSGTSKAMSDISSIQVSGLSNKIKNKIYSLPASKIKDQKAMSDISSLKLTMSEISSLRISDIGNRKVLSDISRLTGQKKLSDISSLKLSEVFKGKSMSDISRLKISDFSDSGKQKLMSEMTILQVMEKLRDKPYMLNNREFVAIKNSLYPVSKSSLSKGKSNSASCISTMNSSGLNNLKYSVGDYQATSYGSLAVMGNDCKPEKLKQTTGIVPDYSCDSVPLKSKLKDKERYIQEGSSKQNGSKAIQR